METIQRSSYIAIKNAFYPQAGIGVSANALLLFLHASGLCVGPKPKPTDLTIIHLAAIHILMLLTMGLLLSTDIWGAQAPQRDLKCKLAAFLHKAARALSLCTTCLLSTLQAATLSPRGSWWANFKLKSPSPLLCLFLSSWVLAMALSSHLLLHTVTTSNDTGPGLFVTDRCSFLPMSRLHRGPFFFLMGFRDVFFVGLMAVSSAHMTILLSRHARRSRHVHSPRLSPGRSPERRATRRILLLSGCFGVLYCADSILSLSVGMAWTKDPVLACVHTLVANGYSTVSPLVLMGAETQILTTMQTTWAKKGRWLTKRVK